MKNFNATPTTDNHEFLSGKQLAQILDVTPSALSNAVKQSYKCGGYPVTEWAERDESGRVIGYHVPQDISLSVPKKSNKRCNPTKTPTGSLKNISARGEQAIEDIPERILNQYSTLPKGEDYVRPVGMASLSSVLKKAIEHDTPQSRAIITTLLSMLGALTGHAVTDDGKGAGIGAGAGLGIALLSYQLYPDSKNWNEQTAFVEKDTQTDSQNGINKSEYSSKLYKELNLVDNEG